ncbi:hypothetical protein EMCRGX_G003217 [Ephydatia muelleri]
MSKPLLLPEPYGGEAGGWAEWVDHFENVATVNKWATGEEKLKWLKVRLTGKAQTAFKKLPQDVKENYVAFGVKQKRPTNVEEAVVATIELESYLGSSGKPLRVSAVSPQEPDPDVRVRRADRAEAVAAVSPLDEPQTVKLLGERLQRLEMLLERQGSSTRPRTKAILGLDFLEANSCVIDCGQKVLTFPSQKLSIPFLSKTTTEQGVATVGLVLKEKTVVPAGSEMEVMVKIAGPVTNGTWFVGHKSATCNGVMVANAVVSPSSNEVPVRILNPRDEMVVLKKGTQIASMEFLEQDPVINISTVMKNAEVSLECQNILWDLVSKVGSHISESEREQLYSLLVEFADVFSFSSKDLGRTKELKHHIFTSDAQPVHLSPRRIPQARREEGKRSNKKRCLPIPRVDDTLDTLVGSKFFTTLDLASGYWQVEVAPEDQPKTAFTTPEGLYQFKSLHTQIMSDVSYSDTDASDVGIGAVLSQVSDCGSERVIAYASRSLTRPEQRQCGRDEDIESENTVMVGVVSNPFQKYTPAEMRQMQLDDTTIQPVHCAVSCGQPTSPDIVKSWSRGSRLLMQHWDALCIYDGILWKKCVDGSRRFQQLVLPAKLQVDALRDLHQGAVGGHIGEEKMKHRLKERFYWPGCTEAVGEWCRNCISCTTRKTVAPKRRAPLQTIKAGYPMQIVSVDLMGPLPETEDGCKYVMVAVDCFTRWVEVYAIRNQEATTVAKKLVDEMFCRFSPPEQLHSDQGRQFESDLVKEICELLQIRKTRTTPYHPQCNGMVERFNQTLLDMLSTAVGNHQADWQQHIRKLCLAYNSSVHSSTGLLRFDL